MSIEWFEWLCGHGEMTERPNVAVLKTAVRLAHRGFESPPLRSSNAITFRDTEFANEGKT